MALVSSNQSFQYLWPDVVRALAISLILQPPTQWLLLLRSMTRQFSTYLVQALGWDTCIAALNFAVATF
jgi:hypothetical protein